jgi:predicted SprT family Zn-dependent metalloprotease
MIKHGLSAWRLDFMNNTKTAALTHFKKHLIELSVEFTQAYDQEQLTQLVLHEIAHAYRGRGKEHAHDERWLFIARLIGYTGDECMPADYPTPKIVWDIVCTTTGLIQQVHTAPDAADCKNCNSEHCTPIVQRRQIVRADLHTIPTPPHIAARAIRKLFRRP